MNITKNQVIFAGALFHLLAAIFSVGYHQCDELFQVFEFAGYKLGINDLKDMPWEFAAHMRSGIEPLIVYSLTKLFFAIGIANPFHIAAFLRIFQGLISFIAIVKLTGFFEKQMPAEKMKIWLWAFSLLLWCIPYFHVRLSSENFSATLFLYAIVLVLENLEQQKGRGAFLAAGFLLGLSFICRFQMTFMIAGLIGWLVFIKRAPLNYYVKAAIGFCAAIGLGLLVDKWLYGQWVVSWWNYLYQNIFENKASIYGESPFYFYISEALLQLVPPFSIVFVWALVGFWLGFRSHILTWLTVPFIVLHFFVAHKELRFLFPALNFIPVMVLLYFESVKNRQHKLFRLVTHKAFLNSAIVINCLLLLFYTFKPADETSQLLKAVYENVKGENPVLYYNERNPYNNNAGLSYFRNGAIATVDLRTDSTLQAKSNDIYYFSEKFGEADTVSKNEKTFIKVYSSFPAWIRHLNFNGWVDRASYYSIYKMQTP